ncbi:Uncharacterised protein [Bordetella pertussis]|nr:Uncharacterised protein [Bordetella pertussis]CPI52605.1 Uncharacterised protein [Bordetella pertussis]
MVVAGAQVRVAAQPPFLAAQHQRHLGVRLVRDHAIDHVRAHFLQARGPVDVGLLVKARHQLHHHGDFLAGARRRQQDLHQLGVLAGAVDGLLDRHHVRVQRRGGQEVDDRLERLVGMVQQAILLGHGGEQLGRLLAHAVERRRHGRQVGGKQQVRPGVGIAQLHQARQVHRAADPVGVLGRQREFALQVGLQVGRGQLVDLQPHGRAEIALRQLALQGMAQVGDFLFVDEQVAVARHAPLVTAQHFQAGEQFAHEGPQQRGQQDVAVGMAGDLGRHLDQARQRARRLHHGDGRLAAEGIGARQGHDEIQALVVDARKRMRRIQPDRRQQRHDVAIEDLARPLLLLRVPFGGVMQHDALGLQARQDIVVEQGVLARHQRVHLDLDPLEGFIGRHAVGPDQRRGLALLLLQRRDADLEELVQVGADDAHVAQPFKQGNTRILGHRQHAFIEFQQRQFTIQEQRLGRRSRGHTGPRQRRQLLFLLQYRDGSMTPGRAHAGMPHSVRQNGDAWKGHAGPQCLVLQGKNAASA